MPAGRILKYCVALSVVFHLAVALFAALLPVAPRPGEDVVVVEMADLPRAPDFLPPKPGVIEGARPKPPPVPVRPVPKKELPEPPRDMMRRLLRELPVDMERQPEKEYRETEEPRPAETPAQTARASEQPQEAKPAARTNGARSAAKGSPGKSLRDLTPRLGETVLAMRERSGGRGQSASNGNAVGTEAKAREKGEIAEERGTSAHLKPLSDPELQFLSYVDSIKFKLYLVWNFPYEAQQAGMQGNVVVDFTIGSEGQLVDCKLYRSSGHKILDEEAMRAVRAAAPYHPLPKEFIQKLNSTTYRVIGTFSYEIVPFSFKR